MANNLTFNPTQLPTFARNRTASSALAKALSGGGGSGGYKHRISIKGGVFRLIAEGKEIAAIDERYIDVVIVNAAPHVQRQFYAQQFDETVASAPSCWSSDGVKPDNDVRDAPSSACANCPNNIKGSGNGDSKACRFQQRIALVLESDMDGSVMQLTVPGRSLFSKEENGNFSLQAYARWLEAQKIEPNEVVTRIRFDTKEAAPKLFFKTVRWLTDDEYAIVGVKGSTQDAKDAVVLTFNPSAAPSLPAPTVPVLEDKERPRAKAKAKAKAEEAPSDEEPSVRKAAETPTIPASKGVASLVAQWDTDD